MDNRMFSQLYDDRQISPKFISFRKEDKDYEVASFEYDGKYYLRIVIDGDPYSLDRTAECRKTYRMKYHHCSFKEFSSKDSANRYFLAMKGR